MILNYHLFRPKLQTPYKMNSFSFTVKFLILHPIHENFQFLHTSGCLLLEKRLKEKSHRSARHRGYRQKQYRWVIAPSRLTYIKSHRAGLRKLWKSGSHWPHSCWGEQEPGLSAWRWRDPEVGHERATKINQQSKGHYRTNNPIKSQPLVLAHTHAPGSLQPHVC